MGRDVRMGMTGRRQGCKRGRDRSLGGKWCGFEILVSAGCACPLRWRAGGAVAGLKNGSRMEDFQVQGFGCEDVR